MEAHKVILASSSPFFQHLLRKNKHPHPLIYMRGVKSEDLVAIVDFLYFGEANVYQKSLDSFLAISEELPLKGLTRNGDDGYVEESVPKPTKILDHKRRDEQTIKNERFEEEDGSVQGTVILTSNAVKNEGDLTDIPALDEKVRSLMEKSQNRAKRGGRRADMCTVCGKEGENTEIKEHIEAQHLEVSIPCSYCEKTRSSRNGLRKHMLTHSVEKTHKCLTCNKSFTRAGQLKRHLLNHNGEKAHKCVTCDKAFTQAESLKRHLLTHSGEKAHKCGTCEKAFNEAGNLKKHILIHSRTTR